MLLLKVTIVEYWIMWTNFKLWKPDFSYVSYYVKTGKDWKPHGKCGNGSRFVQAVTSFSRLSFKNTLCGSVYGLGRCPLCSKKFE